MFIVVFWQKRVLVRKWEECVHAPGPLSQPTPASSGPSMPLPNINGKSTHTTSHMQSHADNKLSYSYTQFETHLILLEEAAHSAAIDSALSLILMRYCSLLALGRSCHFCAFAETTETASSTTSRVVFVVCSMGSVGGLSLTLTAWEKWSTSSLKFQRVFYRSKWTSQIRGCTHTYKKKAALTWLG